MRYSTVIPAAGRGERMGLGYNKILYRNDNVCIIEKTLIPFIDDEDCREIILVCSKLDIDYISTLITNEKVKFVLGGDSREESVYHGIKEVKEDYVLIHDGARPFISKNIIAEIKIALMNNQSVIPVVKSKDATLINGKYMFNYEVSLIQTPQAFHRETILKAFEKINEKNMFSQYKDDASIVQDTLGITPYCVVGDYRNIKITTSSDLKTLEVDENA